jgi:4-azaleucine resistance transporter AzlC
MAETARSTVRITTGGILSGLRGLGPIAIFVVPFGIAYGVAAIERGVTLDQSVLMSLLIFSGAAQFAALEFWGGPIPTISLLLTVFAVSARLILMGATLSPWLSQLSRPRRMLALAVLSDLNFADSYIALRRGDGDIGRLVGGGLGLCGAWIAGTAIGAIAGASLGDLDRFGIDVIMATFFVATLIGQWEGKGNLVPAVVAAAVAVIGLYTLPAGWNILIAALAGGLAGGVLHRGR